MQTNKRIILALDGMQPTDASSLAQRLGNRIFAFKGHDLFDGNAAETIARLKTAGAPRVWADYKLHDIPKTVENRAKALAKAGADIVSIHASGGIDMMKAALQAGIDVYAVTVLTSLNVLSSSRIYKTSPLDTVLNLVPLALEAGIKTIVCSPQEVASVAERFPEACLIVPGTRMPGSDTHDQARTGTPMQAFDDGAHKLVIGREVTQAADVAAAFSKIARAVESMLV